MCSLIWCMYESRVCMCLDHINDMICLDCIHYMR